MSAMKCMFKSIKIIVFLLLIFFWHIAVAASVQKFKATAT